MSLKKFAERIVEAATAPEPPKAAPLPPKPVFIPTELVAGLCTGSEVVTKAELQTIREAAAQHDRILAFLTRHTQAGAKAAYVEHLQSIAERVKNGEDAKVSAEDSWTLDDWRTDHETKRKALSGQCRKISESLQPIALQVAERVGKLAAAAAEELEAAENATTAKYGVAYGPSKLLQILQYVAAKPEILVPYAGGQHPKACLAFTGFKL